MSDLFEAKPLFPSSAHLIAQVADVRHVDLGDGTVAPQVVGKAYTALWRPIEPFDPETLRIITYPGGYSNNWFEIGDISLKEAFTHTLATSSTVPLDTPTLVTCYHDGVNLNAQVNSGAVTSTACTTVIAGTSGYTIGTDNALDTSPAAVEYVGSLAYVKNSVATVSDIALIQAGARTRGGI